MMQLNTAKLMSKGQITLPIDIRRDMGLKTGDRVALIYEEGRVIMMNPAVFAMETLQREMSGEWEKAGIRSESDIDDLVHEVRAEVEDGRTSFPSSCGREAHRRIHSPG